MSQTVFKRIDNFLVKHAPSVIGLSFVILIAAAIAASFIISSSSKADYEATMAQHAENQRALTRLVEVNYGATDVAYNGDSMTITVSGKPLQCEGVTVEAIKEKKSLRCAPLDVVEPVNIEAPYVTP